MESCCFRARHGFIRSLVRISTGRVIHQSQCPRGDAGGGKRFIRPGSCERSLHSIAHPTEGTATIYRLGDGKRVLRFTNFKATNGPDVRVYLVAADDARDSKSVLRAGFIDLGALKGNVGDQNYTLGSDVDLPKYRAVSAWCRRFSINFGTAPLTQSSDAEITR